MEFLVLGGGCFWCLDALFRQVNGVISVIPGYAGGITKNPTYEQVCSGTTGHAEVVNIEFDPEKISLDELLEIFWQTHDPTTLNRQGNDVGTQYRSIILYNSNYQKEMAELSVKKGDKSGRFASPIVTEIKKLETFFPAEKNHHNYYNNNRNQPYCALVISPKLKKFSGWKNKH